MSAQLIRFPTIRRLQSRRRVHVGFIPDGNRAMGRAKTGLRRGKFMRTALRRSCIPREHVRRSASRKFQFSVSLKRQHAAPIAQTNHFHVLPVFAFGREKISRQRRLLLKCWETNNPAVSS